MKNRLFTLSILLCFSFIFSTCKKSDENTSPVAKYIVNPTIGDTQTVFVFDASASTDSEDATSALRVRWDWENDGIWDADWSSNKVVNHTFLEINDYNVVMEVIDTEGLTDAYSDSVTVSNGWNEPPHADFYASNTWVAVGQTVFFYDQSANGASNWNWSFGDGETSLEKNPSHAYSEDGNYTVSLSVSNSFGSDTEVKTNYITVGTGGSLGEPCPGLESFTYEGQVYNTVLIGDQCWMKENLNVGTMINADTNQSENGVIEKYCYDNDPENCELYGGLYQWQEAMQYVLDQGVQGICPEGWHLPTNEEWVILEETADTSYLRHFKEGLVGGARADNSGKNLKSTFGWYDDGNGVDLFGFTGLPGGIHTNSGGFGSSKTKIAWFWTSTLGSDGVWAHLLEYSIDYSGGTTQVGNLAMSVRCIKNE